MVSPGTQLVHFKAFRLISIPDYYCGSRWHEAPAEGLVPVPTMERKGGGEQ